MQARIESGERVSQTEAVGKSAEQGGVYTQGSEAQRLASNGGGDVGERTRFV